MTIADRKKIQRIKALLAANQLANELALKRANPPFSFSFDGHLLYGLAVVALAWLMVLGVIR